MMVGFSVFKKSHPQYFSVLTQIHIWDTFMSIDTGVIVSELSLNIKHNFPPSFIDITTDNIIFMYPKSSWELLH